MVDADLLADCAVLDLDIDQIIEPSEQQQAPTNFELWPMHARAWRLFEACENQWRLALGMGGTFWLGLEMTGVEVIRKAHRISDDDWTDVLWQLQVLETTAKEIRNKREARE